MNQQRFGQTRDADDQAVAADEERQQHFMHDVVLSDDQFSQLGNNAVAALFHPLSQCDVVWRLQFDSVGHGAIQEPL